MKDGSTIQGFAGYGKIGRLAESVSNPLTTEDTGGMVQFGLRIRPVKREILRYA